MFSDGFIWFGDCGIRPALLALIAYLIVMTIWCIIKKYKYEKVPPKQKYKYSKFRVMWIMFAVTILLILMYRQYDRNFKEYIQNLSPNYLVLENVLTLMAVLLTIPCFLFQGNAEQYANLILTIVRLLSGVSLCYNYLTGLCKMENTWNAFVLALVLIWLILGATFKFVERSPSTPKIVSKKSTFEPKERYSDLSGKFKKTANRLINIIKMDPSSTYSICVAGNWGIGKTSIVHGALDRLRQLEKQRTGKDIYEVIYINALELDTSESLFRYLFSRIKQILKEHSVYVGIGSTYRKFIGSAIDTITQSSLSILLEGELFSENEDYRIQKKALSDLVAKAVGDGRIIVVVDDIERCHKEKVKDYLFFVKEIASMERCIPIFVTDYNRLVEQIKSCEEDSHIFLDKFFNYTVYVGENVVSEIIRAKQREISNFCSISFLKEADIGAIITLQLDRLDKKENTDSDILQYMVAKDKFSRDTRNTRTMIKLLERLKIYYLVLDNRYKGGRLNRRKTENVNFEVEEYGKEIKMHELLFFLAYTECCAPIEFTKIVYGSKKYINNANFNNVTDETAVTVAALIDGIFNDDNMIEYSREKAIYFIYLLLNREEQLGNAVNAYHSEYEKSLDYIQRKLYKCLSQPFDKFFGQWLEKVDNEEKYVAEEAHIVVQYLVYEFDKQVRDVAVILEMLKVILNSRVSIRKTPFMEMLSVEIQKRQIPIPTDIEVHNQIESFTESFISFEVKQLISEIHKTPPYLYVPYEEILTTLINGVKQIRCSTRVANYFFQMFKREKSEYEQKMGELDNQLEQGLYADHLNQEMVEWLLNETQQLGSEFEHWLRIKKIMVSSTPNQF